MSLNKHRDCACSALCCRHNIVDRVVTGLQDTGVEIWQRLLIRRNQDRVIFPKDHLLRRSPPWFVELRELKYGRLQALLILLLSSFVKLGQLWLDTCLPCFLPPSSCLTNQRIYVPDVYVCNDIGRRDVHRRVCPRCVGTNGFEVGSCIRVVYRFKVWLYLWLND